MKENTVKKIGRLTCDLIGQQISAGNIVASALKEGTTEEEQAAIMKAYNAIKAAIAALESISNQE